MNVEQALRWAEAELMACVSPDIDSKVLLCYVLDKPLSYLYTWPDKALSVDEQERFKTLISERGKGKPVAYLTGHRDFWTLSLKTSTATLIPRPDTEVLVEQALQCLSQRHANNIRTPLAICDLGTGTGAIALALAAEIPEARILGVDRIAEAVALAKENGVVNHIKNADFVQSNWFDAITERQFDMIVSNPPYIEAQNPYLKEGDVRFEPASALTSGQDGLDDIRKIIDQAPRHLRSNGVLLFEHGYQQANTVQSLLRQKGFSHISTVKDYGGHDRVTLGYWNA